MIDVQVFVYPMSAECESVLVEITGLDGDDDAKARVRAHLADHIARSMSSLFPSAKVEAHSQNIRPDDF